MPGIWDQSSFYFETSLGGNKSERFEFGNNIIDHTQNLNQLISTKHGLGVTDGEIRIGDAKNSIVFKHEPSEAALTPHLQYLPQKNTKMEQKELLKVIKKLKKIIILL